MFNIFVFTILPHKNQSLQYFAVYSVQYFLLILKTTKIKFAPRTEQQSAGRVCNAQKKTRSIQLFSVTTYVTSHVMAAASLCTHHGLTANTLICFLMEWSPQHPVCTKSRKTALDKRHTPKHIPASCCAQLQRRHYTPWLKGDRK